MRAEEVVVVGKARPRMAEGKEGVRVGARAGLKRTGGQGKGAAGPGEGPEMEEEQEGLPAGKSPPDCGEKGAGGGRAQAWGPVSPKHLRLAWYRCL